MTTRWKILNEVAKNVPYLWMLTGTPAAQSPVDAYGLAKLVAPDNVPKYYGSFRDRVMYKISNFKWIPKPTAKETVFDALVLKANALAGLTDLDGAVKQIQEATEAKAAASLIAQLASLCSQLASGADSNADGRVDWGNGEGGLQQAEEHVKLMMAGERRP
jgi:hypothetical protein